MEHYAAYCGNSLPTFRVKLSVPFSRVKMEPIDCPETSVSNYHYMMPNIPEEHRSHVLRGGSLKSQKTDMFISDMKQICLT